MSETAAGTGSPELTERMRRQLQGSAREEMELEARLRNLELERRSASAALEREEREMRANLERLQAEKMSNEGSPSSLERQHSEPGKTADGSINEGCVNPYPLLANPFTVIFKRTDSQKRRESQLRADIMSDESPRSPGGQSQASQNSANDDEALWIGDPEAIQSVRRQRKSISQQRAERAKSRAAAVTDIATNPFPSGMVRSQSMRLERSTSKVGGNVSRRGSVKERRGYQERKIAVTSRQLSNMSLNDGHDAINDVSSSSDATPDFNAGKNSAFVFDFTTSETAF